MFKFKYLAPLILAIAPGLALAESDEVEIIIKDHKFTPAEVTVPAGTKLKLKFVNQDPTPEEIDSYKLHREKIIPGNSSAVIFVGPLDAGEYEFSGEFHEDTAKGKLIVK